MVNVWETIIKERITGYDHRKPKKRQVKKKDKIIPNTEAVTAVTIAMWTMVSFVSIMVCNSSCIFLSHQSPVS